MAVLLIGTLDTKGIEFQFVHSLLQGAGIAAMVADAGVLQPPLFPPDISREQIYAAAGTSIATIQRAADRGQAIEAAARGVARIALGLHPQGKLDGVLALGGSAGTTIGTAAMRAAIRRAENHGQHARQRTGAPYVGVRDILMMHSVVDISGFNRISRIVLANAANAMIGMVAKAPLPRRAKRNRSSPRRCSASRRLASKRPATCRARRL